MRAKPNIILIVMDAVRADALSFYGYDRETSPNIDDLCMSSTVFKQAISTSSWTIPTHASLFTGLLPSEHGMFHEEYTIRNDVPTLAELLNQHGYNTIMLTANPHLIAHDGFKRGFEKCINIPKLSTAKNLLGKLKRKTINISRKRILEPLFLIDSGANQIVKYAKGYITQHRRSLGPFFMFINFMEAHDAYSPRIPYCSKFTNPYIALRENIKYRNKYYGKWAEIYSDKIQVSAKDLERIRVYYDSAIAYLDHIIGYFIDFLENRKILNNTLLIILSDHGESFGENGVYQHTHLGLYEQLIRIPMIIRYPSAFPEGQEVQKQVQITDILQTLLNIVGVSQQGLRTTHSADLRSKQQNTELAKWAYGELKSSPSFLAAWERRVPDFDFHKHFSVDLKMIRTVDSKLIRNDAGQLQFYKLNDYGKEVQIDLGEKNSIEELKEHLEQVFSAANSFQTDRQKSQIDETVKRRLEELGYL